MVNEQVERLEEGIAHFLPDITSSISVPVITILVLFAFDWRLTLASLAIIPLWIGLFACAFRGSMVAEYNRIAARLNSIIIQYTNGIKVIKAFTRSSASVKEFRDVVEEMARFYVSLNMKVCAGCTCVLLLIDLLCTANAVHVADVFSH